MKSSNYADEAFLCKQGKYYYHNNNIIIIIIIKTTPVCIISA